jgi:hypothetical protein
MKTIDLWKSFSAEERMTRDGGAKLREMILKMGPVKLQFHGKPIASVSFFDEGIAKLGEDGWTRTQIFKDIQLDQIHPRDKKILEELVRERCHE